MTGWTKGYMVEAIATSFAAEIKNIATRDLSVWLGAGSVAVDVTITGSNLNAIADEVTAKQASLSTAIVSSMGSIVGLPTTGEVSITNFDVVVVEVPSTQHPTTVGPTSVPTPFPTPIPTIAPTSGTCYIAPQVLDGTHGQCAPSVNGSECLPNCNAGYTFVTQATNIFGSGGTILCIYGTWIVGGACIRQDIVDLGHGIDLVKVDAVHVQIVVSKSLVGNAQQLDYEWALNNEDVIRISIAKTLGVEVWQIMLEVIEAEVVAAAAANSTIRKLFVGAWYSNQDVVVGGTTFEQSSLVPTRRLQNSTDTEIAFGLRIYLILPASADRASGIDEPDTGGISDVTVAADKLRSLVVVAPNSLEPPLLFTAIQSELEVQGKEIPHGLNEAKAEVQTDPEYVKDYVTAARNWRMGPWSACSTRCGT